MIVGNLVFSTLAYGREKFIRSLPTDIRTGEVVHVRNIVNINDSGLMPVQNHALKQCTPLIHPIDRDLYIAVGATIELQLWTTIASLSPSALPVFRLPDILKTMDRDELVDVHISIDGSSHSTGHVVRIDGRGLAVVNVMTFVYIVVDLGALLHLVKQSESTCIQWEQWGPLCCRVITGRHVAVWGHRAVVATGSRTGEDVDVDRCEKWIVLDFSNQRGRVGNKCGRYLDSHSVEATNYHPDYFGNDSLRQLLDHWGPSALPCMEYAVCGPYFSDPVFYIDEDRLVLIRVRAFLLAYLLPSVSRMFLRERKNLLTEWGLCIIFSSAIHLYWHSANFNMTVSPMLSLFSLDSVSCDRAIDSLLQFIPTHDAMTLRSVRAKVLLFPH